MSEQCAECGEPPKGVTMHSEMDGWSCPYCGHYNKFGPSSTETDRTGGQP